MKYILITGCTNGGIGCALVQSFASRPNLHIFATSRKVSAMSNLSALPNVTLLPLDVTDPSSISSALNAVSTKTNGKLDYLLNYAGTGYTMPFIDADIDICKQMYEVNVWGTMRVTQAFAPLLVVAKGTIVIAGSTAELLGLPFQGPYCGSKAALRLMSESMRVEMKPLGVDTLYVTTGNIASNWFANNPPFHLPENSMYKPIKSQMEIRAKGKHDTPWMKTDVYAEKVVGDILANKKGRVYRGALATAVWLLTSGWIPQWLVDHLLIKGSGLETMKPPAQ